MTVDAGRVRDSFRAASDRPGALAQPAAHAGAVDPSHRASAAPNGDRSGESSHDVLDLLPGDLPENLAAAALALARRLQAGGTLWCAAPSWPHHASHIAVEFVHPVVVGTRALPAVALPVSGGSAAAAALARGSVASGDVLLVVASADDPTARDLLRRAPAWGATTLWIGVGPEPATGAADHVLWLPAYGAAHDGRLVLLYHLLWELTHVCLQHAALIEPEPACAGPVCITCSDEGRLVEVVSVDGWSARARSATGLEDVDLALVEPVVPHDLLLVHAGAALARLAPP